MTKDDSQPVSIRFKKDRIEQLKTTARRLSAKRDEDVSYVDLIREAVDKVYPAEKT
mgnify:CR=1 FL=1